MSLKVPVYFFHDVLCAYCVVTAERLRLLQAEFGDALELTLRPFPLRFGDTRLEARDVKRLVRTVRKAAKEPEGAGMTPEIWLSEDPPISSLPPLLAVEAALLQGRTAQDRLVTRLRNAAFRAGVDVTRRDVLLEVAAASGLDMTRFIAAFDAQATARAVELSHRDGVLHGVRAIPAVTIGDSWMMTGIRELSEYRDALARFLDEKGYARMRMVH